MMMLLLRARFPFSIFIHFAIKFHNGTLENLRTAYFFHSLSLSFLAYWFDHRNIPDTDEKERESQRV